MPRANKPKRGPWTGRLAEPIIHEGIPLNIADDPAALAKWHAETKATIAALQFDKIPDLARRYNIPLKEDLRDWRLLAVCIVALADDLDVPGFRVEVSGYGPISQPGAGRPKRDPTFIPQLIRVIDFILATGTVTTDDGAIERYVETHHPELAGPQNTRRRAKRVKTLKNLLAAGRVGATRKQAGELH